jgi:antitoxin component YwqK of YwqJK toxin-antitoxin module
MNLFSYRFAIFTALLAAIALFAECGSILAQERSAAPAKSDSPGNKSAQERVTIQPYNGPPIFLDEREVIVPPSMVGREKITEKFDGSDKVRVEREVAKFSDNHYEPDGLYREYYPNGQTFAEGTFSRGRQQGEWTYYHENGKVNRKATYKDGQPDGAWEVYRADGTLAAKRAYDDGKRDGEWIVYNDKGDAPLREEHYADGKRDGVWKVWFPNGKLKQEIGFQAGVQHGKTAEWDENGKQRGEINYVDGKLHGTATLWTPDGRKVVQKYDAGRLVSEEKQ